MHHLCPIRFLVFVNLIPPKQPLNAPFEGVVCIPQWRNYVLFLYLGIPAGAKQMNPSCTLILSLDGPLKGLYFLYHFKSLKKKDDHYCWTQCNIGSQGRNVKKSSQKLMKLKVVIFCFHLIISQFITLISNAGRDEALIIYYFAPTKPWFFSSVIEEEKKNSSASKYHDYLT